MISVVIPAHNEEKYIERCLKSVLNQSYKDFEILVVSNGSTDKTAKIARKYSKVIEIKQANVAKARNVGVKHAKGDILAFLDSDSYISRHLLKEVGSSIKCGYVGGVCKTLPDRKNLKADLMWFLGNIINYVFILPNGFFFCTREDFRNFNEKLKIAEDSLFIRALEKRGKLKYISNEYVKTSMRRFEKNGYLKTIYEILYGYFFRKNQKYKPIR